jgi:hypothetical protein
MKNWKQKNHYKGESRPILDGYAYTKTVITQTVERKTRHKRE